MQQLPFPLLKNVVLVGGGHAHALVLRAWAMNPVAGARITVINPHPTAPYTGMLPGYVAGHYTREELDIDLVKLARFADARFVLGLATAIDPEAQTVTVPGRPPIPYDVCSIDIGITSEMPTLAGFTKNATPAKPLDNFADTWTAYVNSVAAERPDDDPQIAVIGGGIGGIELAMAMQHRLKKNGRSAEVTVIDGGTILREVGEAARLELTEVLDERGINRRENCAVTQVDPNGVLLADGTFVEADFIVGVAGARPYEWVEDIGVETDKGFITIDDTLRSVSHRSIFAVGDCANMAFDPRPKAGVFAVRQAPVLAKNIAATLREKKLDRFDPQDDYLKLVSLGEKAAAADKYKRFVKGPALWRLKDKIDRDFMDKLNDLPEMQLDAPPRNSVHGLRDELDQNPPLCGGCGAKVGIDVLAGPLGALPTSSRTDVTHLPGDDAALLHLGSISQVITTDQLREFTTDTYRMAKIAALHAIGDVWAMGASPQAVLVTVTLPQLGRGLQEEWLGEIMAGTTEALSTTGAEVVGGHTSMGAELSIGYTVTGIASSPITLAGALAGQKLVLTRPLGSGVLFAAEMQRQARGQDVVALLDILEQPQGELANVLVDAGATAMTDVTGFGLAGHLYSMLLASSTEENSLGAELDLDAIPLFEGAAEASLAGVRSHIYESNFARIPLVQGVRDPRAPLLFDPQTAGGFLAAVPAQNADAAAAEIAALGHQSAVIGSIDAGETQLRI